MERESSERAGSDVPDAVVSILADPQRQASAVYGRTTAVRAAEMVMTEIVDALGHGVRAHARGPLEWLLRIPKNSGIDLLIATLDSGLGATMSVVDGVAVFVEFVYGISGVLVSAGSQSGVNDDERLVRSADAALCVALESRRRMAVAGPGSYTRLEEDLDLAVKLKASSEGDFQHFYQPIVRVTDRVVAGYESLVRWVTADGVLLPADFLAAAEHTSTIVPIGRNGVTQAVRALRESIEPLCGPEAFVSINLSRQQLLDATIVDHVVAEIDAYGVQPGQIWIEVQENEVIGFDTDAQHAVERLHDSGCIVCIDDLGSGFSALRYVRDLPVDVLKVDRALISQIARSATDLAVVRAICEIAETMNIATVAEGVEQSIDFSGVETLGFQFAQGIYFGAPEPFSGVTES